MKRLLLLFFLVISLASNAADVEINGIYYELNSSNYTAKVKTSQGKYSGYVVIPSSVTYSGRSYSVTSIGNHAFSSCKGLTSVTIPSSVTSIGEEAFYHCNSLTSVTIPNSVTSIGNKAFYYCSGLTSVTIPNSVTSIGDHAFYNCSGLTSVSIPNSVTSIADYAFSSCSGLTSVNIPNSVTSIGGSAFEYCSGLTSVTIPNSITSIGNGAFRGCSSLTSVSIPNSVTSIGSYAFSGCSGLTSVTIPNSITSIGNCAFDNCSGLTSVTIPNSVTSIGSCAFSGCYGLTKAEFSSIESLCKMSFDGFFSNPLYSAHHLYIDGKEVTNLEIPSSVERIADYAFSSCKGLTSVTIPSSVTSIGEDAFFHCNSLTSVTIPNSVTSIGSRAFKYCSGLTKALFSSIESLCKISFTDADSNPLYNAHHLYIDGKEVTNLDIPSTVTSIGRFAFSGCSGLTSVTIPNSVTSIGSSAFSDCSGLTSVTIPNSVTSIRSSAFSGCSGLTSVTIPNSVTSIGSYAFSGCSGLTSVTIPNSVTSIESWAFLDCSRLRSVIIPSSVEYIGVEAFSEKGVLHYGYLYFMGIPASVEKFAFRNYGGRILASSAFRDTAMESGLRSTKNFYAIEGDDWGAHISSLLMRGLTFFMPYSESVLNYRNIRFNLEDGTPLSYTKTENGSYTVSGLKVGTEYNLLLTFTDGEGVDRNQTIKIKTATPSYIEYTSSTSTQSTVTIDNVVAHGDDSCGSPEKVGILCKGIGYTKFPVVIKGLYPGEEITVQPFAYYDGARFYGASVTERTSDISLSINRRDKSYASTLTLEGGYTECDAEITDEKITLNGKTYVGHVVTATGLDPNTKYNATYSLKANGHEFTTELPFTTPGLTMVTKQPKVISAGNVIVAAEANIDEAETNVGFEWRREDWSEEFNSNVGGAYMYNGQMEGYIRNLYKEKLWKYRPYYLSDSGNYYYGDWVGIDPCNTSYFEATVHTYNQITVEGNTALVKGFALPGSDDITVQGFVYWKRVSNSNERDGRLHAASVPSDAKMVEAKGQVMTATLPDLDYSSEYCYTAFVTTRAGETFYGEEMTFQTGEDPMSIDDVVFDGALSEPVTILGYYDMNGRRIQEPQHGLYIIRYSDGSSRKLMRK